MTTPKDGPRTGTDWFWSIIAAAQGDRDRLRTELMKLGKEEVRGFQEEFLDLAGELTVPPFDAFVEESEDGLTDVAEWVVSQGKAMYEAVLADPASIPHTVEGKGREILSGVAPLVYEDRFAEPLDL